jgi:hypothetical protein
MKTIRSKGAEEDERQRGEVERYIREKKDRQKGEWR